MGWEGSDPEFLGYPMGVLVKTQKAYSMNLTLREEAKEALFSFPKDVRKEWIMMECDFLLLSTVERRLRAKLERLFDGEYERYWERAGDDMDALAEIGMVCEDAVRRPAGHDSVVRVDSLTETASGSRSGQSSMTTECIWA